MKHPSGKVKLAKSLELRGSGWAKDINLAFISIQMIFKATGVDELTQGESKEKGIYALLEEFSDILPYRQWDTSKKFQI